MAESLRKQLGLLTILYLLVISTKAQDHYGTNEPRSCLPHHDKRWEPPPSCKNKTFGWKCMHTCNCKYNAKCNPVTGECPTGCKEGFYGTNCKLNNNHIYDTRGISYRGNVDITETGTKCLNWKYVRRVRNNDHSFWARNYCRNEKSIKPWCYVSKTEYEFCNIPIHVCPPDTFGNGCIHECHCKNGTCDQNGVCKFGCAPGWTCQNCQKRCLNGTYGESCRKSCGYCKDTKCDPETGICFDGCQAGYYGDTCKKSCPDGRYGYGCIYKCGNCSISNICDKVTGVCKLGCLPGFKGATCHDPCSDHHYGKNCHLPCGYCRKGKHCDPQNGTCYDGCASGYMGDLCRTECEDGHYGENCNMTCGWCVKGNKACNRYTGHCLSGCQEGYEGSTCAEAVVASMKGSTTAAVVAALLAFVLFVFVASLVFHKYRRNQKMKNNFGTSAEDAPETHEGSKETDPFLMAIPYENGCTYIPPTTHSSPDISEIGETDEPFYANVNTKKMNSPVPLDELYDYIQGNKMNNNAGFKKEFKQLPEGLLAMCNTARREENKDKNRYKDIIAYDHSRVHLDLIPGDPYSDYVNASYLDGYKREKAYTASQGPNKAVVKDFWRMVWQTNICKIVMLTDTVEACKKKCEKYWPDSGTQKYGEIIVENIDNAQFTDYVIRTFKLNSNESSRIVKHFHFTTWSDHGAPTYPTTLLIFKRKVKMYNPDSLDPILVHCSAGSGRTGTFVALDYCMDQAKAESLVDVLGCVQLMRTNRVNMIQNLDQYIFVYDALLEAVKAGDTTIPMSVFNETYQKWGTADPKTLMTKIEEQFQVLHLLCPPFQRDECRAALESENLSKNRFKNILPANRCRPYLYTVADDCNDYINAVFLPGYTKQIAYIVTQMPLPKTLADFWRLLYDHQSDTVVMLNEFDRNDKTCGLYWPEEYGYTVEHGPLIIQLLSSSEIDPIVAIRVFQLRHVGKGEERAIKQFQFKAWPSQQKLPNSTASILRLYQQVQEWLTQNGRGPITVHCMDGARRSGLFCAICAIFERMKVDREVDVFQTVKQIRVNRPQFIEDVEQYDFCYKVVQQYLNSQ